MAVAMRSRSTRSGQVPASLAFDEAPRFDDLSRQDRIGSMSIYSAREAGTGRAVVLKVVDENAPEIAHQALQREASYLAALGGHPNIATLFHSTTLADGREALVLASAAGSLTDAIADKRLTVAQSVSMAIKVAGALETVHRGDLVHCAVRPSNILLTEFDEPVLADFSVTIERGHGGFLGLHETTAHTAPELLLGDPATPATDVYGLASTLYELVAGHAAHRAYDGESPAAISLRILGGQVRPVISPDVPLDLSDLLVWALNPDVAERPPGAAWLAEELGRIEQNNGWLRTRMVTGEPRMRPGKRRRFFR